MLLSGWKLILAAGMAGALAGLIMGAFRHPVYHATSTLEIQGITDNVLKAQDGNPNAGADAEVTDMQTQIRIMRSRSLLEPVVARLGLGLGKDGAARMAVSTLGVVAVPQTRIIEIGADSTDPRIAANFVNALAEEYIDQHVEARWEGTQRTAVKLKAALSEMRSKLEDSEDAMQRYARQSGLVLAADRGSVSEERLRQLQSELSRAEADRVTKQSRRDAILNSGGDNLQGILDDSSLRSSRDKLTDLRRQLAEISTTFTPEYSKVKKLAAQIEPIETAMRQVAEDARTRASSEFEEAKRREELLTAAYRAQAAVVSEDAEKKVHYDVLRREVESTRALYETMLTRVKEAGMASTMRGSNVRVLDAARVPAEPYRPRRSQMALMGGFAGIFLGAVFLGIREETNRTIQVPGDLNLFLKLPEFGAIPAAGRQMFPADRIVSAGSQKAVSALDESFRSILASILFHPGENGPRVLAVTSANAGEGKTTVTASLAAALAEVGKRVLLVDGDMRCPRLHQIFLSSNFTGLSTLLADPLPLTTEKIESLVCGTAQPALFLFPLARLCRKTRICSIPQGSAKRLAMRGIISISFWSIRHPCCRSLMRE